MRHSEGSRDELPEAPPGPRGADLLAREGARPTVGGQVALRRGTTVADGASRSRSAGVGRGGAGRRVSPRVILRAWSGPQAVSSVRRSTWPAGPSQEAGFDCQSVGVVERAPLISSLTRCR